MPFIGQRQEGQCVCLQRIPTKGDQIDSTE